MSQSYVYNVKTIIWPDRDTLQKTMPDCFQVAFGKKVAVILDYFEIFIERPSGLQTRASTWSNYKHHNTAKVLLGIAPQGVIKVLGRPGEYKHRILNKLTPGDIVLHVADRGFDIADCVGIQQCQLYTSALTRGKSQLSTLEVHET